MNVQTGLQTRAYLPCLPPFLSRNAARYLERLVHTYLAAYLPERKGDKGEGEGEGEGEGGGEGDRYLVGQVDTYAPYFNKEVDISRQTFFGR